MTKQIDTETASALLQRRRYVGGNTVVAEMEGADGVWGMKLHHNLIAVLTPDDKLYFTMAGWDSPTTRNRLNGLRVGVYQKNYEQHVGDQVIYTTCWYRRESFGVCTTVTNWRSDWEKNKATEPYVTEAEQARLGAMLIDKLGLIVRNGQVNTAWGVKAPIGLGASLVEWIGDAGFRLVVK